MSPLYKEETSTLEGGWKNCEKGWVEETGLESFLSVT